MEDIQKPEVELGKGEKQQNTTHLCGQHLQGNRETPNKAKAATCGKSHESVRTFWDDHILTDHASNLRERLALQEELVLIFRNTC